jgi:hypothetical protein
MSTKGDHYEIREYNIDVLEDREDSSSIVEGRPYPIYPSKGGLNPDFLRDTISRFCAIPFFVVWHLLSFKDSPFSQFLLLL